MRLPHIACALVIANAVCWPSRPAAAEPATLERPNIVFIMADDVGVEVLGCYGGKSYPTPNLDTLAAGGMRFRHCYSLPVCHPTRICLLTGRYPSRMNSPKWGSFPKTEEARSMGSVMRRAHYATAVAGKWQLTKLGRDLEHPRRLGFDEYALFGWHEGPRYYQPLVWQNGKQREDVEDRFGPDVYCDALIDFMTRQREQRFFAFYSMALCHDVTDDLAEPVPYGRQGRYDSYAEMARAMDVAVGKIARAVDRLKLRERTLIVFTGDNGTPKSSIIRAEDGKYIRDPVFSNIGGKRVRGGKGELTDGGTHVPLIASWPGVVASGAVVDDLVDFSDFLPTFAELGGAALPEGVTMDGQSFAGRLRGVQGHRPRKAAYVEHGRRRWVRTQRWKLYDGGQLYDMRDDPLEQSPIKPSAKLDREAAAARQQLTSELSRILER